MEMQPLDKSSCMVRNQLSTKDWAFKSPDSFYVDAVIDINSDPAME